MFWWIAAALCAFFIKGLCGFANTLVFTSILSFGSSNIQISPVELLLGYPTNLILAYQERKSIRPDVCIPLALLVIAGSIPGILFLKAGGEGAIKVAFGFAIIAIGIEMLLRERQAIKRQSSKWALAVIGILSGLLCGLYGVGALLGAYVSRVSEDSHAFKGNICAVFLAENTLRIILYAAWGILSLPLLRQALLLAPAMLAGLAAGMLAGKRLNERRVKRLVTVMLIISGLALIFQNL